MAPVTFNTINKWTAGIADTLVLDLLTEAIGKGLPSWRSRSSAVPKPSIPVFEHGVGQLRACGVRLLYEPDVSEVHEPGTGTARPHMFPWGRIVKELTSTT